MQIKISLPTPSAINLTGAAARSAAASDAAAQSWLTDMQAAADWLLAAVSLEPDATSIAEAIRATDAYWAAWKSKDQLAPRWRDVESTIITSDGSRVHIYVPQRCILCPATGLTACADKAAKNYRDELIAAGVPMGDGWATAQYWDDAAARGC